MGGPEAEYWAKIYKSGKKNKLLDSSLYRTYYPFYAEFLKDLSSVYNRDSYNKLKNILNHNEVEITYHICDIDEIHREFENQKYGLIMYGNILQYYKDIPTLDDIRTINRYAKEKWSKMLTDDGQIQIGYGFEIACDAARELLNNDEIKKPTNFEEMAMRFGIEKEKKEGFISNIIKTYGVSDDSPYSIDYIRAVEENDGHMNSKNAILTYKPRQ